ncbi:putative purine permease 11 [Platanthera guangdongensis]|uniref:Probable purine permease n=1 Tax=Platanthera guangdongensis TaxID=2320717 RepID=A0ABR2LP71_9ASPA
MGEAHEPDIIEASQLPLEIATFTKLRPSSMLFNLQWWLLLSLYTLFILAGQTAATLLGRFYYNQGGKSLWMSTIATSSGFPLLIPLIFLLPSPSPRPSLSKLAITYTILGLLVAGDNLMYSYGLLYLPVSTYSLLCSTQLAFNAIFSYILNSQKFTPFIFNSIILLTLAATLLSVHSEGGSGGAAAASTHMYSLGVTLTLAASALFSLVLSLTQLAFEKVIKAETFASVLEMILWTGFISSAASVAGLFAGGEWRGIRDEMVGFEKGRISYAMTLIWISVCWLVYSVGSTGLIFMVSSLFSNVFGTAGLPLIQIFAVVFFREKMDGVKVVALLISILGFANYLYQHYLDDSTKKKVVRRADHS